MSNPTPFEIERLAKELYHDEAKLIRSVRPAWIQVGAEVRRAYRKVAWYLYVENVEQNKAGLYDGEGDRQSDLMWQSTSMTWKPHTDA